MSEMLMDRGLPASIEAERAVLGAILLDNVTFTQAGEVLKADDFSLDSHRRIYLRMEELADAARPIDFVTLTEKLTQHKEVESVGGVAYVTSLTDGLPRVKNISQYVAIVKDKALLRGLIHSSNAAIQRAYEMEQPAEEIIAGVQQTLLEIAGQGEKPPSLKEVARWQMDEWARIEKIEGPCVGLSMDLDDMDWFTTGFRRDEMYVFGGRPGTGKTSLACQWIRKNCRDGKKVGIWEGDIPGDQILVRLACMETGISIEHARDVRYLAKTAPEELRRLKEATAEIAHEWSELLFIDDRAGLDIRRVCAVIRYWASIGVELGIVDYLGKIACQGRSPYERGTEAISALRNVNRQTHMPLAVLCQLSRVAPGERPSMDKLRDSGQIEEHSPTVGLLFREVKENERGQKVLTGKDEIILEKNRHGPPQQHIDVVYDGKIGIYRPRIPE